MNSFQSSDQMDFNNLSNMAGQINENVSALRRDERMANSTMDRQFSEEGTLLRSIREGLLNTGANIKNAITDGVKATGGFIRDAYQANKQDFELWNPQRTALRVAAAAAGPIGVAVARMAQNMDISLSGIGKNITGTLGNVGKGIGGALGKLRGRGDDSGMDARNIHSGPQLPEQLLQRSAQQSALQTNVLQNINKQSVANTHEIVRAVNDIRNEVCGIQDSRTGKRSHNNGGGMQQGGMNPPPAQYHSGNNNEGGSEGGSTGAGGLVNVMLEIRDLQRQMLETQNAAFSQDSHEGLFPKISNLVGTLGRWSEMFPMFFGKFHALTIWTSAFHGKYARDIKISKNPLGTLINASMKIYEWNRIYGDVTHRQLNELIKIQGGRQQNLVGDKAPIKKFLEGKFNTLKNTLQKAVWGDGTKKDTGFFGLGKLNNLTGGLLSKTTGGLINLFGKSVLGNFQSEEEGKTNTSLRRNIHVVNKKLRRTGQEEIDVETLSSKERKELDDLIEGGNFDDEDEKIEAIQNYMKEHRRKTAKKETKNFAKLANDPGVLLFLQQYQQMQQSGDIKKFKKFVKDNEDKISEIEETHGVKAGTLYNSILGEKVGNKLTTGLGWAQNAAQYVPFLQKFVNPFGYEANASALASRDWENAFANEDALGNVISILNNHSETANKLEELKTQNTSTLSLQAASIVKAFTESQDPIPVMIIKGKLKQKQDINDIHNKEEELLGLREMRGDGEGGPSKSEPPGLDTSKETWTKAIFGGALVALIKSGIAEKVVSRLPNIFRSIGSTFGIRNRVGGGTELASDGVGLNGDSAPITSKEMKKALEEDSKSDAIQAAKEVKKEKEEAKKADEMAAEGGSRTGADTLKGTELKTLTTIAQNTSSTVELAKEAAAREKKKEKKSFFSTALGYIKDITAGVIGFASNLVPAVLTIAGIVASFKFVPDIIRGIGKYFGVSPDGNTDPEKGPIHPANRILTSGATGATAIDLLNPFSTRSGKMSTVLHAADGINRMSDGDALGGATQLGSSVVGKVAGGKYLVATNDAAVIGGDLAAVKTAQQYGANNKTGIEANRGGVHRGIKTTGNTTVVGGGAGIVAGGTQLVGAAEQVAGKALSEGALKLVSHASSGGVVDKAATAIFDAGTKLTSHGAATSASMAGNVAKFSKGAGGVSAIVGGVVDVVDGINRFKRGDNSGGTIATVGGAAEIGLGVAMLSSTGSMATLGPIGIILSLAVADALMINDLFKIMGDHKKAKAQQDAMEASSDARFLSDASVSDKLKAIYTGSGDAEDKMFAMAKLYKQWQKTSKKIDLATISSIYSLNKVFCKECGPAILGAAKDLKKQGYKGNLSFFKSSLFAIMYDTWKLVKVSEIGRDKCISEARLALADPKFANYNKTTLERIKKVYGDSETEYLIEVYFLHQVFIGKMSDAGAKNVTASKALSDAVTNAVQESKKKSDKHSALLTEVAKDLKKGTEVGGSVHISDGKMTAEDAKKLARQKLGQHEFQKEDTTHEGDLLRLPNNFEDDNAGIISKAKNLAGNGSDVNGKGTKEEQEKLRKVQERIKILEEKRERFHLDKQSKEGVLTEDQKKRFEYLNGKYGLDTQQEAILKALNENVGNAVRKEEIEKILAKTNGKRQELGTKDLTRLNALETILNNTADKNLELQKSYQFKHDNGNYAALDLTNKEKRELKRLKNDVLPLKYKRLDDSQIGGAGITPSKIKTILSLDEKEQLAYFGGDKERLADFKKRYANLMPKNPIGTASAVNKEKFDQGALENSLQTSVYSKYDDELHSKEVNGKFVDYDPEKDRKRIEELHKKKFLGLEYSGKQKKELDEAKAKEAQYMASDDKQEFDRLHLRRLERNLSGEQKRMMKDYGDRQVENANREEWQKLRDIGWKRDKKQQARFEQLNPQFHKEEEDLKTLRILSRMTEKDRMRIPANEETYQKLLKAYNEKKAKNRKLDLWKEEEDSYLKHKKQYNDIKENVNVKEQAFGNNNELTPEERKELAHLQGRRARYLELKREHDLPSTATKLDPITAAVLAAENGDFLNNHSDKKELSDKSKYEYLKDAETGQNLGHIKERRFTDGSVQKVAKNIKAVYNKKYKGYDPELEKLAPEQNGWNLDSRSVTSTAFGDKQKSLVKQEMIGVGSRGSMSGVSTETQLISQGFADLRGSLEGINKNNESLSKMIKDNNGLLPISVMENPAMEEILEKQKKEEQAKKDYEEWLANGSKFDPIEDLEKERDEAEFSASINIRNWDDEQINAHKSYIEQLREVKGEIEADKEMREQWGENTELLYSKLGLQYNKLADLSDEQIDAQAKAITEGPHKDLDYLASDVRKKELQQVESTDFDLSFAGDEAKKKRAKQLMVIQNQIKSKQEIGERNASQLQNKVIVSADGKERDVLTALGDDYKISHNEFKAQREALSDKAKDFTNERELYDRMHKKFGFVYDENLKKKFGKNYDLYMKRIGRKGSSLAGINDEDLKKKIEEAENDKDFVSSNLYRKVKSQGLTGNFSERDKGSIILAAYEEFKNRRDTFIPEIGASVHTELFKTLNGLKSRQKQNSNTFEDQNSVSLYKRVIEDLKTLVENYGEETLLGEKTAIKIAEGIAEAEEKGKSKESLKEFKSLKQEALSKGMSEEEAIKYAQQKKFNGRLNKFDAAIREAEGTASTKQATHIDATAVNTHTGTSTSILRSSEIYDTVEESKLRGNDQTPLGDKHQKYWDDKKAHEESLAKKAAEYSPGPKRGISLTPEEQEKVKAYGITFEAGTSESEKRSIIKKYESDHHIVPNYALEHEKLKRKNKITEPAKTSTPVEASKAVKTTTDTTPDPQFGTAVRETREKVVTAAGNDPNHVVPTKENAERINKEKRDAEIKQYKDTIEQAKLGNISNIQKSEVQNVKKLEKGSDNLNSTMLSTSNAAITTNNSNTKKIVNSCGGSNVSNTTVYNDPNLFLDSLYGTQSGNIIN